MIKFFKNKIVIITLTVILVAFVLFGIGKFAFNAILNYTFDYVMTGEELTYSDDGEAGFLRLKSDKDHMSVVCVIMGTNTFLVSDTPMREKDIKSMCWGIDSYDLFFDSDEQGEYCYLYEGKGKWCGPLYYDKETTLNNNGDEIKTVYLKGERTNPYAVFEEEYTPMFEDITGQIDIKHVPEFFVK